VVRNLADNAARHAAGRIDLAQSEQAAVRLTIDDDGPGIRNRTGAGAEAIRPARGRVFDDGGSGLAIVDGSFVTTEARYSSGDHRQAAHASGQIACWSRLQRGSGCRVVG
jgi:hypothetical protein